MRERLFKAFNLKKKVIQIWISFANKKHRGFKQLCKRGLFCIKPFCECIFVTPDLDILMCDKFLDTHCVDLAEIREGMFKNTDVNDVFAFLKQRNVFHQL